MCSGLAVTIYSTFLSASCLNILLDLFSAQVVVFLQCNSSLTHSVLLVMAASVTNRFACLGF